MFFFWQAAGIAAWRWTLLNGLWPLFECVWIHHQECRRVCRTDSRSFDAYQMLRNCQILFRMPHTPCRQRAVLSYEVVCLSCSLLAATIRKTKICSICWNSESPPKLQLGNWHLPQFHFIKVKTMYNMKYEGSCHSFLLRVAQRAKFTANWQREIEHFVGKWNKYSRAGSTGLSS